MKGIVVNLESAIVLTICICFQLGYPCVIEDEPAQSLTLQDQDVNNYVLVEEKRPSEVIKQDIESWQKAELMKFLNDEVSECPEGMRWYTRAQECVPENCPGGNKYRDVETGLCIRKAKAKFKPFRMLHTLE